MLVPVLAGVLVVSPRVTAANDQNGCVMLQPQQTVHVELSPGEPERMYCIRAEKGQRIVAEISHPQGVEPSGRVIAPSGEMDGGPGGPFYSGECRESGIYKIQFGQRGPKRTGSYDLTIEVTAPR